ncbi:MAG: hypothetical protein U5P41_05355 [Gammaproteobacteria bacterium]|nr:hypothetical protein [Gammaproteobacteria bacterium]
MLAVEKQISNAKNRIDNVSGMNVVAQILYRRASINVMPDSGGNL